MKEVNEVFYFSETELVIFFLIGLVRRIPFRQEEIFSDHYPFNWTKALKRSMRERDNYTCQVCGKPQAEECRLLSVHHIDYKKGHCRPSNLITLCSSCHTRTNTDRESWTNYFRKRMEKTPNI